MSVKSWDYRVERGNAKLSDKHWWRGNKKNVTEKKKQRQ